MTAGRWWPGSCIEAASTSAGKTLHESPASKITSYMACLNRVPHIQISCNSPLYITFQEPGGEANNSMLYVVALDPTAQSPIEALSKIWTGKRDKKCVANN
jgi:hypothetical protein